MTNELKDTHLTSSSTASPSVSEGGSAQPTIPPGSTPQPSKSMSRGMFLGLLVIAITLVAVILFVVTHGRKATKLTTTHPVPITVQITNKGFSPSDLAIKSGTVVEWINSDISPHRVAANPYPSHSDLPGLDSKSNLGPGSTYSYRFTQVGTFAYHDELHPTTNGSVVVK